MFNNLKFSININSFVKVAFYLRNKEKLFEYTLIN